MADFPAADEQALQLVARELAATLNDVRIALEAAAENPAERAPVAGAADLLHVVRGVLRVVEVYGAALLAEEMESSARWLAGSSSEGRQFTEGLDALMRASVQLPTYLERVLSGGRDLALVLLPLLNDLRAVRGAPLLSEGTLLSLNLRAERTPQPRALRPGEPNLSAAQWARRLRPRFQAGLLGLIRGEREDSSLIALAEVATRIEETATTTAVFQLWWVVGAVLEALRGGGLTASATIKRLLGQADRELRQLYESGEEAYAGHPPLELLNNLLFYIGRADDQGARVAAVRSAFRLDELLPVDEVVEQERESLSAPSVRLMRTVAAAIKEDLGRVKDAFDLHTRKGGPAAELAPQVEMLQKVGDTLAVLGLGSMRERVQGELGRLHAIIDGRAPGGADALIDIAATLIGIEDGLDDALVQLIMPPGAPAAGVEGDPEFRQVTEAVLRECIVDLARIKELLGQVLEPGGDPGAAAGAPVLARGITAALLMLGRDRAMELMQRITGQVTLAAGPAGTALPTEYVERLADAIVGIEYYMETLQAGRGDPWYMLDNVERCLAALDGLAAGRPALVALSVPATLPAAVPAAMPSAELAPPAAGLALPAVEPVAVVPEPTPEPVPPAAAAPPLAAPGAGDPELLALFIDEAREEIATIGQLFPLWDENPADREALARVRRGFHTLKGSGRMVGADRIGDFAWAVEHLLNRIIDGTLERSHAIQATLREAVALLPRLVDEFEGSAPAVPEAGPMIARAEALVASQPLPPPAPAAPAGFEPTQIMPPLEPVEIERLLAGVPPPPAVAGAAEPAAAGAAPTEPVVEEAVGPAGAAPAEPLPEQPAEVAREPVAEALPEPMPEALPEPATVAAPEQVSGAAAEPGTWIGRPLEFTEAGDAALQEIYRKETQSHLEVVRAYLREAWATPGPHFVTEDLYRACHTLRGASRTAEAELNIRLAEPLHRWLRRMFDHDAQFDEAGLHLLADAAVAFEDVLNAVHEASGYFPDIDRIVARLRDRDAELERALAEPPPAVPAEAVAELPPASAAAAPPASEPELPAAPVPAAELAAVEPMAEPVPGEPSPAVAWPETTGEPSTPLSLEALVPEQVAAALEPEPGTAGLVPPPAADAGVAAAPPYVGPPAGEEPPEPPVAAGAPPAPAAEEEGAAPQDFDQDIAAIFCEEATELLETADAALGALRAERGSRERVIELQRALHTLKGGARMAGIVAMGDLSHQLEWLLMHVGDGSAALDERSFEVLQSSLDELNRMRDYVNAGRPVAPARDLITRIRRIGRPEPAVAAMPPAAIPEPLVEPPLETAAPAAATAQPEAATAEPEPATTEPEPAIAEPEPAPTEPLQVSAGPTLPPEPVAQLLPPPAIVPLAEPPVQPPAAAAPREAPAERGEVARVDADLLDTLLNAAGEVSIFRARVEQQLASVEFNLVELSRVVQRLKDQLRKLEIETEAQILNRHVSDEAGRGEFDPLELDRYSAIQQYSRALAETSSDVASVQGLLESQTREAQNLLTQQGRLISDLQGGLMRTRMVPFQRHVQRLARIVRQVAAETGKKAELVVAGAAGELDRQVLERMLPPLEHLLRNAIAHGIEMPAERLAAGKPEGGRIELRLRREGSEVVIAVADDGAGINLKAVRDRAVALGLTTPRQELSDEQALQLIFEPGFSTAGKVTQTAGRGVGMDIVATEIKKLGGSLYTETVPGQGTCFTARLPFTLAISQALIARAGEELFALPLPTVEGVVRVPRAEVNRQLGGAAGGFEYAGQRYRFQHLATLVGGEVAAAPEHDLAVPVILVRAGENSTAIVTDELIGSREIVVKSVGPQISGIRGITGATILGDGRICVILDIGALVRSEWRQRQAAPARIATPADQRVFALVVDDSITVRRVTQRLLERNGMRVATARDGLDAIAVLQDEVPDVILLDIEMPRMDGYEVASHVRNDPRLKDIPIVMITSRVGEKHRARAIELGVNAYLGKPYQESQLLQALEPLIRSKAS